MDLVTLVAAFGASKKYTDSLGSGITNIQVSPDGTSLIFTTTNGSTFTISVNDWNAITLAEKEKLDKIIVSGDGNLFLSNDGVYKLPSGGDSNYNSLENKPSINGNQLLGDKTGIDLGFSTVATTGSYNDLSDKPSIPTLTSQLSNDSGFVISTVDNLINYYLKSDTYTRVEVNNLIGNVSAINVNIVTVLPTENISLTTIYLIQIPETNNYNQWMYINSSWANIGSTTVDLTNYYNKTEIDTLLSGKVDKITGYGLSQENYTLVEKTKLTELSNYTLPIATPSILGGIKPDNSTTFVDVNGVLSAVGGASGVIDDAVTSLSKTWSSTKISEDISAVGEIANDISIAQKTVHEKNIIELLSAPLSFSALNATTNGTGRVTSIQSSIILNDTINNYHQINFILSANNGVNNGLLNNTISISKDHIIFNNSNVIKINDGSFLELMIDIPSTSSSAWGAFHLAIQGWFKTTNEFYVYQTVNSVTNTLYTKISILSIQGVKPNVTIDPVEYVNTNSGLEDTPVGHIINMMSINPPKHYLNCDGSVYNITDYPYLSQHIKDHFGSFNFFGGDGITTFAIPDLTDISSLTNVTPKMTSNILPAPYVASSSSESTTNNQAYRAFDSTISQSTFLLADGDITGFLKLDFGSEQSVSNFSLKSNSSTISSTTAYMPKDFEIYGSNDNTNYTLINTYTNQTSWDFSEERQYSFNKIVKYRYYRLDILTNNGWTSSGIPELTYFINSNPKISCIKYEPTYFMNIQGLIEETTLWEGNVGTSGTTRVDDSITLSNSFMNYDMLGVYFEFRNNEPSFQPQYKEIHPTQIDEVINSTITNSSISFTWGYGTTIDYTDIKKTSTYTRLDLAHYQSYIKKVIGYKYKTF